MIKFFQKLQARKGFTLVELIVVIAIIGVLAAILIPTMLGYVTSSRVTSANTTAASIKNNIDSFLTKADTNGYGMKQGAGITDEFDILVTSNANIASWNVSSATAASYKTGSTISWGATATAHKDTSKVGKTNAVELMAIELAQLFPEIHDASIHAVLSGGKCVAVAFTADQNTPMSAGTDYPTVDTLANNAKQFHTPFSWDTKTAGVSSTGLIVGTAPVIPLG